jgi:hypothetical protein
MIQFKRTPFMYLPFLAACAAAGPLSDSLPIEGHFSQAGQPVSRFRVERFLLKQDTSADLADRSLGYKWSGHAIGATLWCVNLGVVAYEINQVLEAIKNQSISIDTTGRKEPFSNSLYKFIIPLTIGTEAASFVQSRLYDRSDYLLHEGALAYNASAIKKFSKDAEPDLHIEKKGYGDYTQGGLGFSEPVLYGVLMDKPTSRARSVWSVVLRETGIQAGAWAGTFLGLALISYLQEYYGDTSFAIDKKARDLNLTVGVSLTAFSIVSAVVSSVIRNKAIEKYNAALPKRTAPMAPGKEGILEGKPAAVPDSSRTGISEGAGKALTDTTAAKKDSAGVGR